MLKTRVIPCLLWGVDDNCVKGRNFDGMRRVGDMMSQIQLYVGRCVDELIILDISGGPIRPEQIKEFTEYTNMPLTVGGGISTIEDIATILRAGADKVAICSAAFDYDFVREAVCKFGAQAITIAVNIKKCNPSLARLKAYAREHASISLIQVARTLGIARGTVYNWARRDADFPDVRRSGAHLKQGQKGHVAAYVECPTLIKWFEQRPFLAISKMATDMAFDDRGRRSRELLLVHVRVCELAGAGEILLTSIEREGSQTGYDLDLIRRLSRDTKIPIIAHGGAGSPQDCLAAILAGAHAVAAGSMFHFTETTPKGVSRWLDERGIPCRLE